MRLKEDKIHSRGLVHLELEGSSASNRLLRNHWLFRYGKITQTSLALRHNETTGHLRGRLLTGGEDKIHSAHFYKCLRLIISDLQI